MTSPNVSNQVASEAVSESATIIRLDLPKQLYAVRPGAGSSETVLERLDLDRADLVAANAVTPVWENVEVFLDAFDLRVALEETKRIATEILDPVTNVTPSLVPNPESAGKDLIFTVTMPVSARSSRQAFVNAFVEQVELREGTPAPILAYAYFE